MLIRFSKEDDKVIDEASGGTEEKTVKEEEPKKDEKPEDSFETRVMGKLDKIAEKSSEVSSRLDSLEDSFL